MARTDKGETASVSSWSEIIQRQGEEARRDHEAFVAKLETGLSAQCAKVRAMKHSDLVTAHATYAAKYDTDPRVRAVFEKLTKVARTEILKRMGAKMKKVRK